MSPAAASAMSTIMALLLGAGLGMALGVIGVGAAAIGDYVIRQLRGRK